MSYEEIIEKISNSALIIKQEKEIGNGKQIKLQSGGIINYFNNGNYNIQGKNKDKVEEVLSGGIKSKAILAIENHPSPLQDVFVVYGHDKEARDQLEAMIRRWNLEPIILDQIPSEGQTIIEKLENYKDRAGFCIVLATPDDEGYRKQHPEEKAYRARQNVVLELGMMLSQLGRDKVAILIRNQVEMERPSDIQGLIYLPFKDSISDVAVPLAKEMCAKGYNIDIQRL